MSKVKSTTKKSKLKTIYIDQSGKIEQTNINTIVAASNALQFAILLRKKNKRILEKNFRKMGKRKSFPYLVFATLVAILLKSAKIRQKVIIDREYSGHENLIRERVLFYLKLLNFSPLPVIEFGHVGKTSKAHHLARKVGTRKKKADKIVRLEEILELVLVTKKTGSPCGPRAT